MAHNLSWIDNDKLAALLSGVGAAEPAPAAAAGSSRIAPDVARAFATGRPAPSAAPVAGARPRPAPPVAPRPAHPPVARPSVAPARPVQPAARAVTPPARPVAAPVAAPSPAVAPVAAESHAPEPERAAPVRDKEAPMTETEAPVREAAPAVETLPEPQGPAPFAPSAGADLATRIDEYFAWAREHGAVDSAVIADDQGLLVAQERGNDDDAALAIAMEELFAQIDAWFARRSAAEDAGGGPDGHVALSHRGRSLVLVWAGTEHGRMYGLLSGTSYPAPRLLELASQGFRTVFAN